MAPTPFPERERRGARVGAWPWGVAAVWLLAAVLAWAGHGGLAAACVLVVAPWFGLQLLPIGTTAFGRGHRSFSTTQKEVWLTIDDGPDPEITPRLLALLAQHRMKATFFLIGAKARAHPDCVAAIVAAGHEIACHSQTHPVRSFWCASGRRLRAEVDQAAEALRAFGPVRYFRPPVGLKNPWLVPALGRSGLTLVLWSARGLDGLDRPAEACFARIIPRVRPGGILLLHEVSQAPERSVRYAQSVIEWLAREGYATALPDPSRLRLSKRS